MSKTRTVEGKDQFGVVDFGSKYRIGDGFENFVDENGVQCLGLLDGNGAALPAGESPVFLWFDRE